MRRLLIGHSLAALAAVGLLAMPHSNNAPVFRQPVSVAEVRRRRRKVKKGPSPRGKTAQKFDKSRLIADRSSSFKKLSRWARRHPDQIAFPDEKALQRHSWYRRQMGAA